MKRALDECPLFLTMFLVKVSMRAGAFAAQFQRLWTFRRFASLLFCDAKRRLDTYNSIDVVAELQYLAVMAAKLRLICTGKKGDFGSPLTGKIVVDSFFEIGATGEHFLSVGCVSAGELEAEANALKRQLDKIVSRAKRKFPK